MQQILNDAAESGSRRAQSHSLADLLGLCLVALAFGSDLSISKDPAGTAAMASRLAESLSNIVLMVQFFPCQHMSLLLLFAMSFRGRLHFAAAPNNGYQVPEPMNRMHLSATCHSAYRGWLI